MIAIVAGVPEELAALRRRLVDPRPVPLRSGRGTRGMLQGRAVVLAVAGDGPARAEQGLDALLDAVSCSVVLGVGVAGGLTDDLAPGSLVVASSVVSIDGVEHHPEPALVAIARRHGAVPVRVLCASGLAGTAIEKARLRERAGDASAVVDLESAAWAEAAVHRGIPWSILRVVSDAWDEELPQFLVRAQRPDGSVARGRVALGAIAVPTRIPALVRLASRVRQASTRLADGAAAIMSEAAA
jgi:nucleoside phosphorylase